MSPNSDTITLAPITPSVPMVLADASFITTLAHVEQQVASLKIADAQSAQQAADLQSRLTVAGRKLEAARESLKRPLLEKGREIDAAAREPAARIEKAKTVLGTALTVYRTEQERKAAAAEKARQDELARLEKLRLAEEKAAAEKAAELARIAAEAAAKSKVPILDVSFDDDGPAEPPPKTATELAIEAVKHAPAVVAAKPTGVSYKTRLRHIVVSVAELPALFVTKTANDAAIRAAFVTGWKEGEPLPVCPGVKFEIDRTVVSTGRDTF